MIIYTLGHSTRTFEEFLEILKKFKINLVVDVRRFPSSKKFPWFCKDFLDENLKKEGIGYLHFEELGGFRKEGYENFSKSKEFDSSIKKLLKLVKDKNACIFCSELKWWRCHRRYIAQRLALLGNRVIHIFTKEKIQEHKIKSKDIEERMKVKIFCDRKAKKLRERVC